MGPLRPMRIFFVFFFLTVTQSGVAPLRAEDTPSRNDAALASSRGPMGFDQCVRVALEQSPYITSGSCEIEVRRLDESDSRYGLLPALSLRTRYYVNTPTVVFGDSKPYSLGFYTDPYNPLESLFALQARKEITRIAVLSHLQAISGFIQRLANTLLDLDSLGRMATLQDELIALAQQNLAYVRNRMKSESVSPLDLSLAEQELQLAQAEKEKITTSQRIAADGAKALLGFSTHDSVAFDLQGLRTQILNGFDPAVATIDQARSKSYELKIQSLKKELQTLNVKLAYARFLPTFVMGIDNGDPFNRSTQGGYYAYFGLEVPLWDGLKRAHNISRQKTVLKQFNAEEQTKENDLTTSWNSAQAKMADAVANLRLARSREELLRLKKRQKEISYQEGREVLSQYLAESRGSIEARKNSELKDLEYVKAALALYALSGELSHRYVEPNSF